MTADRLLNYTLDG